MNALTIIHDAFAAGVDLNVRGGKLYIASGDTPIPAALLVAIRDHKPDFIHALTVWPGTDTLRRHTLERCRPLTPAAINRHKNSLVHLSHSSPCLPAFPSPRSA